MIDLKAFVKRNTDWSPVTGGSHVYEVRSEEEGVGNVLWAVSEKKSSIERCFFNLWYAAQDYAEGTDLLFVSEYFKTELAQCNAVDLTPTACNGKVKSIVDSIYSKTMPSEITSLIDDKAVQQYSVDLMRNTATETMKELYRLAFC